MSSVITIDQQKAFVDASLNSTLILQFLIGIYTGVFAFTIYIYGKGYQNRSYNKLIAASLVVLFLIAWIETVISWYLTNIVFCKQATTRASILMANLNGLPGPGSQILGEITTILSLVGFVLADSLLVWRCFHANGGRLGGIFLLPMMLLVVETLLAATTMILNSLVLLGGPSFRNVQMAKITNQIDGTTFSVIAATSVTSTVMICKSVYKYTRHNRQARKRVVYVVEIVTQSCGIYTLVAVGQAITSFLNIGAISNFANLEIIMADNCLDMLSFIILGLAPTLMVARLASASHGMDSISTEPTLGFLMSLPPELRESQSDSLDEEVDVYRGVIDDTGDQERGGRDEENCV